QLPTHARTFGLIPVSAAIAFVECTHVLTAQFGPDFGGDPQHTQASRMAALVIRWKLRSIVLLLVEETQRDKPPIDCVTCLGRDFGDPAGRNPGKGADRVPEEFNVIVTHTSPFLHTCRPRLSDTRAVVDHPT